MKRGRKEHSHEAQDGTKIQGLRRTVDGRWRFWTPDGREVKFIEPNEALAIRRFRQATGKEVPTMIVPVGEAIDVEVLAEAGSPELAASIDSIVTPEGRVQFTQKVTQDKIWEWLREQIVADAEHAAKMLRIPAVAHLDFNAKATLPISVNAVRDLYADYSESNWRTKGQVKSAMNRLTKITGAETLADLTTAKLIGFRENVNSVLEPTGAGQVFGKIKSALAFAMKHGGLDNAQLATTLARLKVLYAPRSTTKNNPTPIKPAEYRKLLAVADSKWRAILLLALNGALYAEDVATLKWENFDLDAATYTGTRTKTAIIRVMALWPETVQAIRKLPRKGQSSFLFTSATGSRYLATTLYDAFKELRETVGVCTPFSGLRDAGYTIACRACEDRVARVFAAHKMPGLLDSYVQRHPEFVRPAADAVRAAFLPFPGTSR